MCNGMGCCKGKCVCKKIRNCLLIIGGLNWGLVGVGMLMGNDINAWNFIHMFLLSWPIVEGIIYVLVGIAALMKIFGFRCMKCKEACASCCASGDDMNKTA